MRHLSPSREGLCRHQKLRHRAEFLRCYRLGGKRHGSLASVHFHPNGRQEVRLGITASRKVGKAVVRHRLKRQVREIFRRDKGRSRLEPMDVVIHLKSEASSADHATLSREIQGLLASLARKTRTGR